MALGLPYVPAAAGLKPGPFCVFFPFFFLMVVGLVLGIDLAPFSCRFYHEAVAPGLF